MTDTRDPRVAELVTRLVGQAPPAPPFPDEVTTHPEPPRRLVTAVGVALAAALVIGSVVYVASRPTHHPAPISPSTTTPTTTGPTVTPAIIEPQSMAVNADGTLYVADVGAHRVVTLSDRVAHLVANVQKPQGLAFDREGNLYIADIGTDTVLKVNRDGVVTTYAGDGTAGFAGDGGPATRAKLDEPIGLAFGPDGALYIADEANVRIRRVATDGTITTLAGNGTAAQTGDGGPATDAGLDPEWIAFDGAGNLVVFQFDTKAIRRIDPDGIITSVQTRYASGLATRPDGDVEIADYGGFGIALLSPDGTITNLPFEHSGLFRPIAIAVAPNGDAYVADDGRGSGGPMRIMLVHPDGTSSDITPTTSTGPLPSTPDPRTAAAPKARSCGKRCH